ncbi:MarR family transcriptional regulator [Arthrobacter sp. I2-34]|uniref:MarR family transcriptional regulator n=1 Tax=Arthrobacter hankyongi TaxID=2904801 RepID=A0ABS9L3Y5_9MICC|nr:MarR family transcriptional regulator [Arthrobacter hankyongi]MCG2621202.1 MarR family transcriptional regulator [Arthrobacter hankyongi]
MPRATSAPTPDVITDPLEWAQHYWREHGLEGGEVPFLVFSSLLRYHRMAVAAVEDQLRAHDLNLTDYLLLMTLELSDSGTRLISSLARSLMVHATTATLATDRLETRKLLKRSPHPTDRRAICVTITPAGRDLVRGATKSLSGMDFGLAGGAPENLRKLGEILTELRRAAGDTGKAV